MLLPPPGLGQLVERRTCIAKIVISNPAPSEFLPKFSTSCSQSAIHLLTSNCSPSLLFFAFNFSQPYFGTSLISSASTLDCYVFLKYKIATSSFAATNGEGW